MKIEYSKDDLKSLNFNYIVQINNNVHYDCIFSCPNPMFWIEKRIRFVVAHSAENYSMHGYYYGSNTFTEQELVDRLNKSKERYYRILNDKELAWFNNWQKLQRS